MTAEQVMSLVMARLATMYGHVEHIRFSSRQSLGRPVKQAQVEVQASSAVFSSASGI